MQSTCRLASGFVLTEEDIKVLYCIFSIFDADGSVVDYCFYYLKH